MLAWKVTLKFKGDDHRTLPLGIYRVEQSGDALMKAKKRHKDDPGETGL